MTLYANAEKVYTDLVHATIPCLLLGVPVQYWSVDGRKDAFLSLDFLHADEEGFLFIDEYSLRKKKEQIEKYVLNKLLII